jgi:hypothetical protein
MAAITQPLKKWLRRAGYTFFEINIKKKYNNR